MILDFDPDYVNKAGDAITGFVNFNGSIAANKGNEDVTLILSYKPSESHKEITGVFKDQKGETVQKLSISAENTATVYLNLYGEPDPGINGEVIGTVSYEQAG